MYTAFSKPEAENALGAANGGKEGYELVEIMRRTRETHRNIVDMKSAFVKEISRGLVTYEAVYIRSVFVPF